MGRTTSACPALGRIKKITKELNTDPALLDRFFKRYLTFMVSQRRSPRTIQDYSDTYRTFISKGYASISDETAGAFLEQYTNTGSRNKYLAHLNSFVTWTRKTGIADEFGLVGVLTLSATKEDLPVPQTVEDDVADSLIDAIREVSPAAAAHATILRYTGLRFGEAVALKRQHLFVLPDGNHAVKFRGKGRRERVVPLNEKAYEAFQIWIAAPISTRMVREYYRRAMKKIRLTGFRPHHFRHTAATKLREKGATYEDIADYFGNSVEVTRERYAKADYRKLSSLAEQIS